jgi:hypothetical protein
MRQNILINSVSTNSGNYASRNYAQAGNSAGELSDYVAHLQLHMALQSRNLVPYLGGDRSDSRSQLLQETQSDFEKIVSRQ